LRDLFAAGRVARVTFCGESRTLSSPATVEEHFVFGGISEAGRALAKICFKEICKAKGLPG
jgi:hypothetical protein